MTRKSPKRKNSVKLKTKPAPKKEWTKEAIIEWVAVTADYHGLHEADIPRFPDLLPEGLTTSDLTPGVCRRAHEINRQALQDLLDKYGCNKQKRIEATEAVSRVEVKSKRPKFQGLHAASLIRWLASEAYSRDRIVSVLRQLDMNVADATIGIQMSRGRRGEQLPEVTEETADLLFEMSENQ